jgi:hypothetical protein
MIPESEAKQTLRRHLDLALLARNRSAETPAIWSRSGGKQTNSNIPEVKRLTEAIALGHGFPFVFAGF